MNPSTGAAARLFLAFAFAYFLSALLRAVTATLAPSFSAELGLDPGDLGLLAGAYFLGFAVLQLPLGAALDRFGPKRVLVATLALAVVGCAAFASATSVATLVGARGLIGMGVAACLMAPLTTFRHRFSPEMQLRANSWMLMTGSLGMVASTLPVQWLLPQVGWRGLFWGVGACLLLAMLLLARVVPTDAPTCADAPRGQTVRYRDIARNPVFVRFAPLGFFVYGGLIAIQSLWAGPWLTGVAGWSANAAAAGLFAINLAMLAAFMAWGLAMPRLVAFGVGAPTLVTVGVPLSLAILAVIVVRDEPVGAAWWAIWCVACSFVSPSQPAVGQAFPAQLAGRALSAFNLVIFAGVFCVQWGIGLGIELLEAAGWERPAAFRIALAGFGAGAAGAYAWFLRPPARWRE